MRALRHLVRPGVHAELRFAGDTFEMEDQRNWTDASFKTFCTPLRLPYPVTVPAGSTNRQSVTLKLERSSHSVVESREHEPLRFAWSSVGTPLPALGLGMASDGLALEQHEIERLRALRLSHLRVDLPL